MSTLLFMQLTGLVSEAYHLENDITYTGPSLYTTDSRADPQVIAVLWAIRLQVEPSE